MSVNYSASELRLLLRDRATDLMNAALDNTKPASSLIDIANQCLSLASTVQLLIGGPMGGEEATA